MLITSGYDNWINQPRRTDSGEIHFGAWWEMNGTNWRVSWIEDTGELYATELGSTDRFILLGHFSTKKEIMSRMHQWFEGDNLDALIHKFKD